MSTEWKSQQGDGKYSLQFETDDREKYLIVEKAVQSVMDCEEKHKVIHPMMYKKNIDFAFEIFRYYKDPEGVIYFETGCNKYRLLVVDGPIHVPTNGIMRLPCYKQHYIFEMYNPTIDEYENADWVDHIELIEGVNIYDKT